MEKVVVMSGDELKQEFIQLKKEIVEELKAIQNCNIKEEDDKALNAKEVQRILGISKPTLHKLMNEKVILRKKLRGKLVFSKNGILNLLKGDQKQTC